MAGIQYANVVEIKKQRSEINARTVTLPKMRKNNGGN